MAEPKKKGQPTKFSKPFALEMIQFISEHGLIDYGGTKLRVFCENFHIDANTFRAYKKRYPWFNDEIEKAKEEYKRSLAHDIASTLRDAAKGGFRTEEDEVTEYRPNPNDASQPIIVRMTKTKRKKYIKPDVAAAIFLATNLDPEHFQNRQRTDVALRKEDGEKMTLDEINAEIERLEKVN